MARLAQVELVASERLNTMAEAALQGLEAVLPVRMESVEALEESLVAMEMPGLAVLAVRPMERPEALDRN